jgi:hypothetical protein
MDLRNLPDVVADLMLGTAHELDETAIDHELINGSTVTGKALRFVATSLVLGAIPWVLADVIAGGATRRGEINAWHDLSTDYDQRPVDMDPVWWDFLKK